MVPPLISILSPVSEELYPRNPGLGKSSKNPEIVPITPWQVLEERQLTD